MPSPWRYWRPWRPIPWAPYWGPGGPPPGTPPRSRLDAIAKEHDEAFDRLGLKWYSTSRRRLAPDLRMAWRLITEPEAREIPRVWTRRRIPAFQLLRFAAPWLRLPGIW